MKKLETTLTERRVFSQIDECSITGTVLTENDKLVSESGIVLDDGEGGTIIVPLLRAPEFIKELQAVNNEMTGMVQRTTTVREHTVVGHVVAEHDRKIPLGRKDIAAHPHNQPHCAAEPVNEKQTMTGTERKRRRNFTYNEVKEIRQMRKDGASVAELCDAYNANDNNMRNLLSGKSYSKVK